MLAKLIMMFRIPELRNKILLTVGLLAVYRLGFWIPLPFIDQEIFSQQMKDRQSSGSGLGQVIQMVSLFSASS